MDWTPSLIESFNQLEKGVKISLSYLFQICDDAIRTVGSGSNKIRNISLDARQGYHEISVRHFDREKSDLFAPDNQEYTFLVMPFGPTNTPDFYSDMMKNFKYEWYVVFVETLCEIGTLINEQVALTETYEVFIGYKS